MCVGGLDAAGHPGGDALIGLLQLEVGQAYEINNQKTHSVMNKGDTDRINFIFDYLPPSAKQGRVAGGTRQASTAEA